MQHWLSVARHNKATLSFAALADAAKIIHVPPAEITRLCRLHIATRAEKGKTLFDLGRIIDGDWDLVFEGKRNPRLDEMTTHLSVFQRYVEGRDWTSTPVFESRLAHIHKRGVTDHGMKSRDDLVSRYERLDRIFDDMRQNGYRLTGFDDDISVSISRTGGFLLGQGGKHRLAIAQVLRLPTIPVYVLSRHKSWQQVRENARSIGEWFRHPDLEDLQDY